MHAVAHACVQQGSPRQGCVIMLWHQVPCSGQAQCAPSSRGAQCSCLQVRRACFLQVVIISSTFAHLDHCGAPCRRQQQWSACHAVGCRTAQHSTARRLALAVTPTPAWAVSCIQLQPMLQRLLQANATHVVSAFISCALFAPVLYVACSVCRLCPAGVSRGSCEAFPVSALGAAAAGQGGLC